MALWQTIFTGDITKTGLTPTWSMLKKKSDLTAYAPQPTIREVGFGVYDLDYASVTEAVTGVIDLGATVSSADRYVPVDLYPATDGKIVITDEPAGQYQVVFKAVDGDLSPISNVDVRIYVGASLNPVYTRQTNTSGECKYVMLDGVAYRIVCSKVGYSFPEVAYTPTASEAKTIEGVGIATPIIGNDEQYIYCTLKDVGLTDDATTKIYLRAGSRNVGTGTTVFSRAPVEFDYDANTKIYSVVTSKNIDVEVYSTNSSGEILRKAFPTSNMASVALVDYL